MVFVDDVIKSQWNIVVDLLVSFARIGQLLAFIWLVIATF
jgi:hypothetical protein